MSSISIGEIATQSWVSLSGIHGEFYYDPDTDTKVNYVLTKASSRKGTPNSLLLENLKPWREVFDSSGIVFEELLQRDLNDSRITHRIIPYLIDSGASLSGGQSLPFFPPIVAILCPSSPNSSGIAKKYPDCTPGNSEKRYGDVFLVRELSKDDRSIVQVKFNPQASTFVVADGQHRAMALLALYRQIHGWQGIQSEYYYEQHIPDASKLQNVEIPVSILYFPDLVQGGTTSSVNSLNLDEACRKIFLVVNKEARPVSETRQMLLDDDSIGCFMLRHTLTKLKDTSQRNKSESLLRLYNIDYQDSDQKSSEVNPLAYISAETIERIHSIVCFCKQDHFKADDFDKPARSRGIHDGRSHQCPTELPKILRGAIANFDKASINKYEASKFKGQRIPEFATGVSSGSRDLLKEIVSLASEFSEVIILSLFDDLCFYRCSNRAFKSVQDLLSSGIHKADAASRRVKSIIFDTDSERSVFYSDLQELREKRQQGKPLSNTEQERLADAKNIETEIKSFEKTIRLKRICYLTNNDYDRLMAERKSDNPDEANTKISMLWQLESDLYKQATNIAFQFGFVQTVLSFYHFFVTDESPYEYRMIVLKSVSQKIVEGLNNFFVNQGKQQLARLSLICQSKDSPGIRWLVDYGSEMQPEKYSLWRLIFLLALTHSSNQGFIEDIISEVSSLATECQGGSLSDSSIQRVRDEFVQLIRISRKSLSDVEEDYINKRIKENNLEIQRAIADKAAVAIDSNPEDCRLEIESQYRDSYLLEAKSMISESLSEEPFIGLVYS